MTGIAPVQSLACSGLTRGCFITYHFQRWNILGLRLAQQFAGSMVPSFSCLKMLGKVKMAGFKCRPGVGDSLLTEPISQALVFSKSLA